MLVHIIPCVFLVVVVEAESILYLMLKDFTEGIEIDDLLVDLKFFETAYKNLRAGNLRSTRVKI